MGDTIRIRGARQNNLKGIDLDLPRRALTVITGPSGSGKSSLAFDTLYAEGQRRYVESLSTYAKQFLERMEKPAIDRLEGVSPSVAIDQRNSVRTSRSTVGTVTEVYDYMRLLWARVGHTVCPGCGERVVPDTVQSVTDEVLALEWGTRIQVAFPLRLSPEISHAAAVMNLRAAGYVRVVADGRGWHLEDPGVLPEEEASGADGVPAADGGRPDSDGSSGGASDGPRADVPDFAAADELLVVADRLTVDPDERERLADALAATFAEGEGRAVVLIGDAAGGVAGAGQARGTKAADAGEVGAGEADAGATDAGARDVADADAAGAAQTDAARLSFTEAFHCARCERFFSEPTPGLFSFNHPSGACPECTGFGATLEYDVALIVPNGDRSLAEGALDPWTKPRYRKQRAALERFAHIRGIDMDRPWRELPLDVREELLHGTAGSRSAGRSDDARGSDDVGGFEGVVPFLRSRESKRYKQYIRVFLRQYQRPTRCGACGGARLRPEALHVRIAGRTIAEVGGLTVSEFREWLAGLELTPFEEKLSATVRGELEDRARFLDEVGLGYLTFGRQARTLSGGEMQRIRIAGSLGSRLVDALYVLDEPTIGLHARDVDRCIRVLERLRDAGNTVVVVEHDAAVLAAADHIVELGPASGEHGGEVVFEGSWDALKEAETTTAEALAARGEALAAQGEAPMAAPRRPDSRSPAGIDVAVLPWLRLRGARLHNLQWVDVDMPLGALTVVSGVSGSGKSTLVHDILFHALERELQGDSSAREHLGEETGELESLEGASALEGVVLVDQSPIGRTPRSNPVTYIKAFGDIRRLFAEQPVARSRGYGPGHFSFNVKGGRCEACKGAGEEVVEMVFLADVAVPCDMCGGKRYRNETLEVTYRGRDIRDVLDMTVDEAIRFFARHDRIGRALWQLQRVGLGYLRLGQSATTLSGGEAQRLKIARELARTSGNGGRRLYILDEPTVGLGAGEVGRLVDVLERLVAAGHTVLVVEHNLDVIASADWVIDLGPEAAAEGGRVVAAGTPEEIARAPESHTGRWLKAAFESANSFPVQGVHERRQVP